MYLVFLILYNLFGYNNYLIYSEVSAVKTNFFNL